MGTPMEEAGAAAGGAPPPATASAPPPLRQGAAAGRKRRLSISGGGPTAAAALAGSGGGLMMPFGPVEPGVFDRVASRRLRPQGAEWVLEAEGIRAYLPSLLRLLRDADESKVRMYVRFHVKTERQALRRAEVE